MYILCFEGFFMSTENSEKLRNYIKTISNDTSLLDPFLKLMNKQYKEKPITLFDGLSVYRQSNTNNYSYRINNPLWGVINERKSCKTPDIEQAKIIALEAWSRYKVMNEFDLISKQGETFIQFAERIVIPPLIIHKDHLDKQHSQEVTSQIKKQIKQKFNAVNKRINHLRKNCHFLHNKLITELRLKDFEDFAIFTLNNVNALSKDTFDNYMTVVRDVLNAAVSEGVITSKPDTTLNKRVKDMFNKKSARLDLSSQDINLIFTELKQAIQLNKDNLSDSATSKFSLGKLKKLENYLYYLEFILATGTRAGDECFTIKWCDFDIVEMDVNSKSVFDYYCNITSGKIENKSGGGRKILISKGSEKSNIFQDCLSPLAKLHGFDGIKSAIQSKSNGYIFSADLKDVQRYLKKWKIFSVEFTPYQFRHTYITKKIIETSEPLDRISKQCGNSVNEIQKSYNHATTLRYRAEELSK